MFQIKYRIAMNDIMDELKTADVDTLNREYYQMLGYIQVRFGEHREGGYYHENPLREDEFGDEIINLWIENLLKVVNWLNKGGSYAAFIEIEFPNRWIEFQRLNQEIIINVAIDINKKLNEHFLTGPLDIFTYEEPKNFTIGYEIFKREVVEISKQFLAELEKITPNLLKTRMGVDILKKFSEI